MLTLAAASGIGRFAFTPVLPMMQRDLELSLRAAGWLASANYAGYFAGALSAVWLRLAPGTIVRTALVATALLTIGMGLTHDLVTWVVLRALAGVVSAWALVFSSAWVLRLLASSGKAHLGGVVFGGVGLGTAVAGALCLVFLRLEWSPAQAWVALGLVALAVAVVNWPLYGSATQLAAHEPASRAPRAPLRSRDSVRLIAVYGCSGFGYIVPATFIPALARAAVPDPAVFGWAWPVFGIAALVSTLVAGPVSARAGYRRVWRAAQLVMAFGVALPALWSSMTAIVVSALCVGGTFVVVTLVGLQEARRVAPRDASALIAALTAAFAGGQILGPVLVSLTAGFANGMELCLLVAAAALSVSAFMLVNAPCEAPRR